MKNVVILLAVLFFTSCGTKKEASSTNPVLDGEYVLETVSGKELSSEGLLVTFDMEAKRVHGETGCNGFSSQYIQEGSEVTFTAPISTRMYCEGKMEMEQAIHDAIGKVAKFEKEGTRFTFYSAENEALFSVTKTENQ